MFELEISVGTGAVSHSGLVVFFPPGGRMYCLLWTSQRKS